MADPIKNKKLIPVKDRVIVKNMNFEEKRTKGGLILRSDNGTTTGVHPRWAQVYAKGHENKDEYNIGDWVLVEHGRWTRGIDFENEEDGKYTLRMVETESILLWSENEPYDMTMAPE